MYEQDDGRFPWIGFHGMPSRGVAPGAPALIRDAIDAVKAPRSSSSSTLGGCAPTNPSKAAFAADLTGSPMTPDEGRGICDEAISDIARVHGTVFADRSTADFNVARRLLKQGMEQCDVAAVLMYGSEKATNRGWHYVQRTMRKAMGNR